MKRLIFILSGILIAASIVFLAIKPVVIYLTRRQLSQTFIDSTVKIKDCNVKPLSLVSLSEIEIQKGKIYRIKIKEAGVQYTPFSIIRGEILKAFLKDPNVSVNLGGKSILEFNKLLKLDNGKSRFLIHSLEVENSQLEIKSKELIFNGGLSAQINLAKQSVDSLDLKIDSLEAEGLEIKDIFLSAGQVLPSGVFQAGPIKYNKLAIEKIESIAVLTEKTLYLESLVADLLGGRIEGKASLFLGAPLEYLVDLKAIDIDLNRFVQDFKLEEKVDLTGRMNGAVSLKGKGSRFTVLDGGFFSNAPGGELTIKDKSYLERIARSSGQSLDILVESFKNYRYNTGVTKLALEDNDLILAITFDGEAGKRNLAVTVHDFKLGR